MRIRKRIFKKIMHLRIRIYRLLTMCIGIFY